MLGWGPVVADASSLRIASFAGVTKLGNPQLLAYAVKLGGSASLLPTQSNSQLPAKLGSCGSFNFVSEASARLHRSRVLALPASSEARQARLPASTSFLPCQLRRLEAG